LRRTDPSSDDPESHPAVILKVIRNNDIMRKASEKELSLLSLIARADPEGKKHCVRLLSHSDYRNHIVIVFEPLSMNLRETLKRFGKGVGINITAVRMYARQLFVALRHLSDLKIVHADIKPDNIVVSEDLKTVSSSPSSLADSLSLSLPAGQTLRLRLRLPGD
jgi:serine/threonine-protein kinase PRP4